MLGVIFVVAWTIPLADLVQLPHPRPDQPRPGRTTGRCAPEGIPPGDVPLDEDPAVSPFAGLIQSARFYLIFLLLVWVGATVHAWFAARKFSRKNGIELR